VAHSEHLSDSSVQRRAEATFIAALADSLGLVLLASPGRISLAGDVWVEVDARSPDSSVFVEAYARQGSLKGAQVKKQDILKLALLQREATFVGTRYQGDYRFRQRRSARLRTRMVAASSGCFRG